MLAPLLGGYTRRDDVVVLAISRGGIEIGFEIACRLEAPLGLLLVREIPIPGVEDVAMGVVAEGGLTIRNHSRIRTFDVTPAQFEAVAGYQRAEIERQARKFSPHGREIDLADRIVVLASDGLAAIDLARCVVAAARARHARFVLFATPVATLSAVEALRAEGCDVIALLVPEDGSAVREFYGDFSRPSDDEIVALLERANVRHRPPVGMISSA